MKPRYTEMPEGCRPVREIFNRVGEKWTMGVVRALGERKLRFNELRHSLGGVSQKMLTLTLHGLERDGVLTRTVLPAKPPRVEYELTDLGRDLWRPVAALASWAHRNSARVEAARARYDSKRTGGQELRAARP